jgi:alcohol dehydrogenase (cytochrome c)
MFDTFFDTPVVMPSSASNWSPSSFDPQTGFTYVMGGETLTGRAMKPEQFVLGKRYTGGAAVTPLDTPIRNTITAMDSRTNKIAWQKELPGDRSYGVVSTAGGLVFKGQVDGNLVAYDAKTGDELWHFQTGWGISAPPMTYSIDGLQYVTVASGGNRGGVATLDGDAVWAFSLNGTIDEPPSAPAVSTKTTLSGPLVKIGDPVGRIDTQGLDKPFDGTIDTTDYSFTPVRVSVPAGTTLTWSNSGAVIHTASATNGSWDTGDISAGSSAQITFNTAGSFSYNCNPHPWMLGQVVVT